MINKNNKYIRKIRHDAKALSPVVASIILIAVTVAVSIAVAAWMGGMTIGFMGSSSITVTNVSFESTDPAAIEDNNIVLSLKNTGTKSLTMCAVRVNNQIVNFTATVTEIDFVNDNDPNAVFTMEAGDTGVMTIYGPLGNWNSGNPYKVDLYDGSNQVIGSTQQNAPGA
jgi:archaeal type IV pilus assembly protein PilA